MKMSSQDNINMEAVGHTHLLVLGPKGWSAARGALLLQLAGAGPRVLVMFLLIVDQLAEFVVVISACRNVSKLYFC